MSNPHHILKALLAGLLLTAGMSKAVAQDMQMPMSMHQHSSAQNRSVFLLMMDTMMIAMDAVGRGHSTDQEFILEMIPHHRGAIDMARYEIIHGKSFEMIQLAKSILAEQSSELSQMELWIKQHLATGEVPESPALEAFGQCMETMMAQMPSSGKLTNTDYAFAAVMIPHHQAAVDMAGIILTHGTDLQALAFAKGLVSNEQIEIEQMHSYLKKVL